jgi:capsular polysaccharide biosynthesis protein
MKKLESITRGVHMIENQESQQEISLIELWYIIRRHIVLIITVTTLFFVVASVYA